MTSKSSSERPSNTGVSSNSSSSRPPMWEHVQRLLRPESCFPCHSYRAPSLRTAILIQHLLNCARPECCDIRNQIEQQYPGQLDVYKTTVRLPLIPISDSEMNQVHTPPARLSHAGLPSLLRPTPMSCFRRSLDLHTTNQQSSATLPSTPIDTTVYCSDSSVFGSLTEGTSIAVASKMGESHCVSANGAAASSSASSSCSSSSSLSVPRAAMAPVFHSQAYSPPPSVHIEVASQDEPPPIIGFKCPFCEYTHIHKSRLETHMKIHSGEKPFSCPECGFRSNQKAVLIKHRIKKHGVKDPYFCERCDLTFSTPHALSEHRKVHRGEKPYKCPHCSQGFAYQRNFLEHVQRLHSQSDSAVGIDD